MTGNYFGNNDGPSSKYDVEKAFDNYFGASGIYDGQCYVDAWKGVDLRENIIKGHIENAQKIQKASIDANTTGGLGTGGAGTAGSALIPVYVSPNIVDRTRYQLPMRELTPRVAARGKTYDYNALTAKGGASWKGEDAALPEDVDTYDRQSINIKWGYSVGRVAGPAIAAMRGYKDAMQLDLSVKSRALMELEEDTIINGDAATYPTEFNGLIKSITTNTTNKSTAYVSLADLRSELATTYNAFGIINLCVTDAFTHANIKALLQDFQRVPQPPAESLPFGIPGAFEFDGVPFIRSQFMPTTTGSRRILFLDMRYIFMAVLQDITYEELAKVNDSNKYMMKVYEALVVTFEGAMSQIYGIK